MSRRAYLAVLAGAGMLAAGLAVAAAQGPSPTQGKTPPKPGTPVASPAQAGVVVRPPGPEPSGVTGVMRFVDPTTQREHAALHWNEASQQWGSVTMQGLTLHFRPLAGGNHVTVEAIGVNNSTKTDQGWFGAGTIPRTARIEAVLYRVKFVHTTSAAQPSFDSARGSVSYDPAKHTFVGIDPSRAYASFDCLDGLHSCRQRASLKHRPQPWPMEIVRLP